jgi:hypothetical protein
MVSQSKKYKRYIFATVYRGYQVHKQCTAKNVTEAAEKLGTNTYTIQKWALKTTVDEPIEGIVAHIDSGYIIFDEGRHDLMRKLMPWDELRSIIDEYVNKKYK